MFELKAGAFYKAASSIAETAAWIGATTQANGPAMESLRHRKLFHEDGELQDDDRIWVTGRLDVLQSYLDTLGARVTAIAVEDAKAQISSSVATWGTARQQFEEVRNTLRRELSLTTLLILAPKEQELYAPKEPHFGARVDSEFSTSGAFEIDEAAKCMALGRYTAAVFHLMRVMEVALDAVGRCLQIESPAKLDRSWGGILRLIKDEITDRNKAKAGKSWVLSSDQAKFEGLVASLDAVKVAWRNPTMHVENKYLPEEAEHIFVAVKGFMRALAERCDEFGMPLA